MRTLPILDLEVGPRSALVRYGFALAIIVILMGLRLILVPVIGDQSPYLAFFAAIVFSAWFGGLGPGLLTTLLSGLLSWYLVVPPQLSIGGENGLIVNLGMFLVQGVLVSYLIETTHRSRRRIAVLLGSINDGFFVYDRNWRLVFMNKRGEEMARKPRQEMLGKTIEEVSPEMIGTPFHHGLLQAAKERKPQRFDYYHPPFDSWFEISAFPSREGVTVYARDITLTKRSRKELETAKSQIEDMAKDLERRVEERTGQLHATIKELEAFSYSVSHDLRAPLRAIDGFSKMLQEDYYEKLDDEGRRILDVIRHNTVNMGNLIDGLLAFSRLGRQAIGETTINMTELAHDAMKEALGAETQRNVQFTVHDLPAARGDRVLLRQVLINLVANALKFSRDRNPAVIEIGSRVENGFNVFFVKDNGVGFDMRYADKLFGVFQRLHASTEFEGTGLGLAIVQRIVSRHGGRVWAEGLLDKGATIYFTLPRAGMNIIENTDVQTQRPA